MNSVLSLLAAMPWFAWIAIAAIASATVREMSQRRYRHLERIAMIQQGIHPDAPHAKPVPEREFV